MSTDSSLKALMTKAGVSDEWLRRWVIFLPDTGIPCLPLIIEVWLLETRDGQHCLVGCGKVGGELWSIGWHRFELTYDENTQTWRLKVERIFQLLRKALGKSTTYEARGRLESPLNFAHERARSVNPGAFN